jgi:adenylate kinase
MKLMITGPQGSGKTTQAKILAEKLGLCLVKTGDLVRAKAQEDSAEGHSLRRSLESGDLSDDQVVAKLLKSELLHPKCAQGIVVDGFPRRISQLEVFDPGFDQVFYLQVSDQTAIDRMISRGREDDKPKIIEERLKNFHDLTQPVLDFYEQKGILKNIDGESDIDGVTAQIMEKLEVKI